MVERSDLETAAQARVIGAEQVEPLLAFLTGRGEGRGDPLSRTGEEPLRFVRNFHDWLLTVGVLIFGVGLAVAIGVIAFEPDASGPPNSVTYMIFAFGAGVAGILMWGLAELLRARRMVLPSLAVCSFFTLYAMMAAGSLVAAMVGSTLLTPDPFGIVPVGLRQVLLFASLGGLAAAGLYYHRFQTPFAIGLAGSMAALVIFALNILMSPLQALLGFASLLLLCGAGVFAAAVWYDSRDPRREMRYSENGFWLHSSAAPLVSTGLLGLVAPFAAAPLFAGVAMQASGGAMNPALAAAAGGGPTQAIVTLVMLALLGVLSLLLNRRALLLAGLMSAGVSIAVIINAMGLSPGALIAATLIVLGGLVIILGAGWHGARRRLLAVVKPTGFMARVFPPED